MSQIGTVEEPAVRTAVPEGSLQGAPPAVRAPMGGPFQERLGGVFGAGFAEAHL